MQQYTIDYTLINEAESALYSASRLMANECYAAAQKRIEEARQLLQRFTSQENMVPDNDAADGWVRASEIASMKTYAIKDPALRKDGNKIEKHGQIDSRYLKQQTDGADPANPLYGKIVVESGTYEQIGMTRDEVAAAIQRLGAKLNRDVSQRMNIFVTGNKPGPSKMQKVMKWRSEGYAIDIIDQMRLKEIIDKYLPE